MSDVTFDFFVGDTIRLNFSEMTYMDADGIIHAFGSTGAPDLTDMGTKIQASCSIKPRTTPVWEKKNAANGGSDTQILVTGAASLIVFATNAESAAMPAGKHYLDVVALFPDGTRPTIGYVALNMMWRPTQGNVPV